MHMIISTPAWAQATASFRLLVRISVKVRPLFLAAKRSWMVSLGISACGESILKRRAVVSKNYEGEERESKFLATD